LQPVRDTRSSRVLYQQLLKSDASWLRADASRRLKQLDAIDSIAVLEQLTAEYERRFRKSAAAVGRHGPCGPPASCAP
jgi:hypothetical protein